GVPGRRDLRRSCLMRPETGVPHPIETESYRLLGERVDLSHLGPGGRAVVARVIHASADTDYARTMVVDEAAVRAGVEALAAEEGFAPALVVGLPVGFVGAAEAKAAARESGLPTITNVGEKGGSAVAAAAVNDIARLARSLRGDGRD